MHAQAESVPEHRAHFASSLHVANGLNLYLLTLAGEAMLGAGVRWLLRAAGGTLAQQLLSPLWAAHWRAREYAADAGAASLGQAEDLARHLREQVLPFDVPQRRLPWDTAQHPPTAHRIERLLAN